MDEVIRVDGLAIRLLRPISEGAFGKVFLGQLEDGSLVAVKTVEQKPHHLRRELNALVAVGKHDHVISLIAFDPRVRVGGKERAVFVMDLATKGELFEYIQHTGPFSEATARVVFQQLVVGLFHTHSRNVFHRDIKAENILLDDSFHVKLADFGLSVCVDDPSARLSTTLGSELYMAPEVRDRSKYHGAPADVWSMGVLLFVLLTKAFPFPPCSTKWYMDRIEARQYDAFWSAHFRTIPSLSKGVIDLLTLIFTHEPASRITLRGIINHPWMRAGVDLSREAFTAELDGRWRVIEGVKAMQSGIQAAIPAAAGYRAAAPSLPVTAGAIGAAATATAVPAVPAATATAASGAVAFASRPHCAVATAGATAADGADERMSCDSCSSGEGENTEQNDRIANLYRSMVADPSLQARVAPTTNLAGPSPAA